MKTNLHALAIAALASVCTGAVAQAVSNVTLTEPGMRVSINPNVTGTTTMTYWRVEGTIGPNLVYCGFDWSSDEMKRRLFTRVYRRSKSELTALLNEVDSAASPNQKLDTLFFMGLDTEPNPPRTFSWFLTVSQLETLQMGQEVAGFKGESPLVYCYTPQQIDQAIAEGRRVLEAIIVALPQ